MTISLEEAILVRKYLISSYVQNEEQRIVYDFINKLEEFIESNNAGVELDK